MALTTPTAIDPTATSMAITTLAATKLAAARPTAAKSTAVKPTGAKESRQTDKGAAGLKDATQKPYLSDTFTICTDDPHRPIEFSIYGYIITLSTSTVLKSLFDDPRARAKGIVLHHTRADTLRGYVHWLHTRQFLSKRPEGFKSYTELIEFFLLGEVLKDQVFCQQAVDAMIAIRYDGRKWPGYHVTNEIWERTSPDSPLRKVMKELWMSTNVDKAMRCLKTAPEPGYHRDMILSLLEELISRGVFVKEATFSGRSRKEVEEVCRKFVQGMKIEQGK